MFDPRVAPRAAFFSGMAAEFEAAFPEVKLGCNFRPEAPMILAEAYFMLSDVYKPKRNYPESRTDDFKKGAISAVSVMVIRPFTPLDPDAVTSMAVLLANPIYALACANAWIAKRNLFTAYPFDMLKRFYGALLSIRMQSFDSYLAVVNGESGAEKPWIDHFSKSELAIVDDWVNKLFLLTERKIYKGD